MSTMAKPNWRYEYKYDNNNNITYNNDNLPLETVYQSGWNKNINAQNKYFKNRKPSDSRNFIIDKKVINVNYLKNYFSTSGLKNNIYITLLNK